ncbi:MAG: SH3-like domain-containing protein [Eudoraea sp.]|nr:SH3-like domain-containing protein [Eudoraea sp.]
MTRFKIAFFSIVLFSLITGCKQSPDSTKPISLERNTPENAAGDNIDRNIHEVEVLEVNPTSKYLYVKVADKGREYWMAVRTKDVVKGETYLYNEALIKTQFESKELEKVFDTLYLVTQLVPKDHGGNLKMGDNDLQITDLDATDMEGKAHSMGMYREATQVTIIELLSDPGSFEGKMVEVQGICTKMNANILGRNWIHLQEGDESKNTVVITSQWQASPGTEVKIRALVALDKDFGAGYTYEVILEEGILVN